MRKLIFGTLLAGLATWLYRSEQTRERLRQQLATAPDTFRGGVSSMASATTNGAQRVVQTIDGAPLPAQAKERARTAAAAVQSAAEKMKQQVGGSTGDYQPPVPPTAPSMVESFVPEDVRAEQDAASRAVAEAEQERQAGR